MHQFLKNIFHNPFLQVLRFSVLFLTCFLAKSTLAHSSYADAVEKSIDSVVMVYTQEFHNTRFIAYNPDTNRLERITRQPRLYPSGLGSGIILDTKGHVVTNYHVIKDADKIFLKLNETQEEIPVEIVGYDAESDIALLKINVGEVDSEMNLKPIYIANSDNLRVGDEVLAIGNPFGVGKTVTQGIISAINRNNLGINTFEDFIQIDAAINRGNSGGALINSDGELIGINSAIYSADGSFSGLAFAIPSNMLLDIVNQLKEHGQVIRGWIGIQIGELEEAVARGLNIDHGVVITSILENSPAFRSNLQVGDVITSVNGKKIENRRNLINIVSEIKPGTNTQLSIIRRNTQIDIAITVRQRPNFIR